MGATVNNNCLKLSVKLGGLKFMPACLTGLKTQEVFHFHISDLADRKWFFGKMSAMWVLNMYLLFDSWMAL